MTNHARPQTFEIIDISVLSGSGRDIAAHRLAVRPQDNREIRLAAVVGIKSWVSTAPDSGTLWKH
jgi:hypothetical protein